jgi:hypothetical protein
MWIVGFNKARDGNPADNRHCGEMSALLQLAGEQTHRATPGDGFAFVRFCSKQKAIFRADNSAGQQG